MTTAKRKWTIGGIISGTAGICSILGFLATSSPSAPQTPPATTSYPAAVQQQFLGQCEQTGSTIAQCTCGLAWFQNNVTLTRFEQDMADFDAGTMPADLITAQDACAA